FPKHVSTPHPMCRCHEHIQQHPPSDAASTQHHQAACPSFPLYLQYLLPHTSINVRHPEMSPVFPRPAARSTASPLQGTREASSENNEILLHSGHLLSRCQTPKLFWGFWQKVVGRQRSPNHPDQGPIPIVLMWRVRSRR